MLSNRFPQQLMGTYAMIRNMEMTRDMVHKTHKSILAGKPEFKFPSIPLYLELSKSKVTSEEYQLYVKAVFIVTFS